MYTLNFNQNSDIYFTLTLITHGAIVISSGTDTLSILAAPIARAVVTFTPVSAEDVVGQEEELWATLGMNPISCSKLTVSLLTGTSPVFSFANTHPINTALPTVTVAIATQPHL